MGVCVPGGIDGYSREQRLEHRPHTPEQWEGTRVGQGPPRPGQPLPQT